MLIRLQLLVIAAEHIYMRSECGVGKYSACIYVQSIKWVNNISSEKDGQ